MIALPLEVWQLIFDVCSLPSQLSIISCCKLFYQRLKIIDFYHIDLN